MCKYINKIHIRKDLPEFYFGYEQYISYNAKWGTRMRIPHLH